VLLVPGNTGDSFVFLPLIAQMTGRRVLALNRPGGGLSEGFDHSQADFRELANDTVNAVLDYFGIDSLPIIAHSMGGHWSLWFAMDNPGRVQKLVLLGVPGNVCDCRPPLALRLTAVPGLNRCIFRAIASRNKKPSLRSLSFLGHSAAGLERLPAELAECYFYFQQLPNYELSSLSLMEETNTLFGSRGEVRIEEGDLKTVSQPVLLIWGGNDPFGSTEKGNKVAAALPNSTFRFIQNGGHLPWLDDPVFCGGEVVKFINEQVRQA
jgi:pimeloyl-ACP methyl ester carboxylesterase